MLTRAPGEVDMAGGYNTALMRHRAMAADWTPDAGTHR